MLEAMAGVQAKGKVAKVCREVTRVPICSWWGAGTAGCTGCKVWEEEAAMALGGAGMEEDRVAGQVGGGNQECHLGRTASEKTSCNASRDAEEASGYRSVVLRGERTEGKCAGRGVAGRGSRHVCTYSAFLLFLLYG